MGGMELVSLDDVRSAAAHLAGVAVRTPLLPCPWADAVTGAPAITGDRAGRPRAGLWLKPESLQPIGAYQLVACLAPEVRARGVATHSSGNHGRALAWTAARFGIPAVVVMPTGAP